MEEQITNWLNAHKDIAIYAVPAFAFLEACVGIGLFISGVILLSVCTLLYTQEIATLPQILPLAFIGALTGDHSGFLLGKLIGPKFHHTKFALKYIEKINKADKLILDYGVYAILVGRLIPAIRSIIPVITGIGGMARMRYFLFDVLACLIWTSLLGVLVVGLDQLF